MTGHTIKNNIHVKLTFEQYRALSGEIEEKHQTLARIIAEDDGNSASYNRFRDKYRLWRSIEDALIMDSEWKD